MILNLENNEINTFIIDGKEVIPKLINSDCSSEMANFAIEKTFAAMEKYTIEKDIASYLKKEFDIKYEKTFHVVVGRDFSVSLTHDSRNFIFFLFDKLYILIFKL